MNPLVDVKIVLRTTSAEISSLSVPNVQSTQCQMLNLLNALHALKGSSGMNTTALNVQKITLELDLFALSAQKEPHLL